MEKCIYCNANIRMAIKESSDMELYIETNSFTGNPYMYDEYSGNEIEINYCPMCGRNLKAESDGE